MQHTSALAAQLAEDVLDRFVRYARVDTQAARDTGTTPSTPGQLDLSRMLAGELRAAGLEDADVDERGYVYATLPGTVPDAPVVGLIAHVDTSPDAPGAGVEPLVHRAWDGTPIRLPRGGTVLDPAAEPGLAAKAGHDLVTSSGDTLLGADDKAGVAEIMAAVAHLAREPDVPRPTVRVAFTVDEEIGEGAVHFDLERFGADFAYTFDGSEAGEVQDETFDAAEAVLEITGVDVHPGFATGVMVNAIRLAGRFVAGLPADRAPETTSGRDGFVHPYAITGDAGRASVRMIVRDFEQDGLAAQVAGLRALAERELGEAAAWDLEVREQYPNMRRHLDAHPGVVDAALEAIAAEGIQPRRTSIRGGTDGSVLSARGLPTPNVFTGGHAFHSVREWASLHDMASAAAVAVRLVRGWALTGSLDLVATAT